MEHKGTKRIETKRLLLRAFQPEDAEPMYRNWASDPEVTKFMTWPTHKSVEVSRAVTDSWVKESGGSKYYQWAIVLKALGEPIGSISVVKINDETDSVTIGYCIGRVWWGQGIVAEALTALIAFFFDEVGANCVNACHDPRNPNSGKVMRKCGMTYEGTWRAGGVNNQGICDECWYSILRKEYEAPRKRESGVIFREENKIVALKNEAQRDQKENEGGTVPANKGQGTAGQKRICIEQIAEKAEKASISRRILEALPEWFGIPEAREEYINDSQEQLFFAAFDEERRQPIGFLCLKETGKATVELAVMGVRRECHRQGIGRELFFRARRCAAEKGYEFLQVKTVQMGRYEEYDATNRFYQSLGFREFEVFPALWGEQNPCQIYVMGVKESVTCNMSLLFPVASVE